MIVQGHPGEVMVNQKIRGRAKPFTVSCRLTGEKKAALQAKARIEGLNAQGVLEKLINGYLRG